MVICTAQSRKYSHYMEMKLNGLLLKVFTFVLWVNFPACSAEGTERYAVSEADNLSHCRCDNEPE